MIDRAKQLIKHSKGIVFDLDGLLIDSEPLWGRAKKTMVQMYGDPKTAHINAGTRGMGLRETIIKQKEIHNLRGDVDMLMQAYRNGLYAILFSDGKLTLMPGVKDFLKAVEGRPMGVATGGHTPEKIWEILQKTNLSDQFNIVVSCDEVEKGKPFPDVYVEAAKRLGVLPQETLVLEDAPNGVMAAKAAGTIVFGVNKDKKFHEGLYDAGADVVVGSLEELV